MEECASLDEVRENIDIVDRRIVELLSERSGYVKQAATFKNTAEEVEAPKRVEEVVTAPTTKAVGFNGFPPRPCSPTVVVQRLVHIGGERIGSGFDPRTRCSFAAADPRAFAGRGFLPPNPLYPIVNVLASRSRGGCARSITPGDARSGAVHPTAEARGLFAQKNVNKVRGLAREYGVIAGFVRIIPPENRARASLSAFQPVS